MRGKSLTMKIGPAKPMPKPAKPLSKTAAAPAKPAKYGIAAPVTPGKLARAPEKDDVLITTRKSPDIIRTTVRERMTPAKKGK